MSDQAAGTAKATNALFALAAAAGSIAIVMALVIAAN